jgi:hypothetical protein
MFKLNQNLPLYRDIRSIANKNLGLKAMEEELIKRFKGVQLSYFNNTIIQTSSTSIKIHILPNGGEINIKTHDLIDKGNQL